MNFKKVKGKSYLLLPLSREDLRYLKDFKRYEHPSNIKALYFMNFAMMLEEDGRSRKNEFKPVVDELEKLQNKYMRTVDRGITRLRKAAKRKIKN
jgi:hypothetical protein